MVGYQAEGNDAVSNTALLRMIKQYRLGNVILYKYNLPVQWQVKDPLEIPEFVADLTSQLQSTAYASQPKTTKIPLLIAIDQEGGPKSRITTGVTEMPSQIFVGTTRSKELAKAAGEAIGSELRAMGINVALGPVADIVTSPSSEIIGRRSFGSHRDIVAPLSAAWAAGLQAVESLPSRSISLVMEMQKRIPTSSLRISVTQISRSCTGTTSYPSSISL